MYALGTSLGSYLLAIAAAEPVDDDQAPVVLPPEQQLFGPVVTGRSYRLVVKGGRDSALPKTGSQPKVDSDRPVPHALAADREPKRKKKKKKQQQQQRRK